MPRRRSRTTVMLAAVIVPVIAAIIIMSLWQPAAVSTIITPREGLFAAVWAVVLVIVRNRERRQTRLREAAATAAQFELGDATLRMLTVLDSISDGVFVCNGQGRLTL